MSFHDSDNPYFPPSDGRLLPIPEEAVPRHNQWVCSAIAFSLSCLGTCLTVAVVAETFAPTYIAIWFLVAWISCMHLVNTLTVGRNLASITANILSWVTMVGIFFLSHKLTPKVPEVTSNDGWAFLAIAIGSNVICLLASFFFMRHRPVSQG